MRAEPIVAVEPLRQFGCPLVRGAVGTSVRPFAQAGLHEALSLAVGFGRVGPGAQMLDVEQAQGFGIAVRAEADAVVGHDPMDLDAVSTIEAQRVEEKAQAGAAFFIGQDFRVSDARMVVDGQVQIFPADPAGVALSGSIAGDPVTDPVELAQLFDVDMDDLTGMLALIAADRLGRLQGSEPVQPEPAQDAADGCWRYANLHSDLPADVALPSQSLDGGTRGWRGLAWQ